MPDVGGNPDCSARSPTDGGNRHLLDDRSMQRAALIALSVIVLVPLRAGAAAPSLTLTPCDLRDVSNARCGRLVVPENRALPDGRTISLRIAVVPAYDTPVEPDPIVHITGGPGGS